MVERHEDYQGYSPDQYQDFDQDLQPYSHHPSGQATPQGQDSQTYQRNDPIIQQIGHPVYQDSSRESTPLYTIPQLRGQPKNDRTPTPAARTQGVGVIRSYGRDSPPY